MQELQAQSAQPIFAVQYTTIHKAAFDGNYAGILYFLSKLHKDSSNLPDKAGYCPIHYAAGIIPSAVGYLILLLPINHLYVTERGHVDALTLLIEKGQHPVDCVTDTGMTPLMVACKAGHAPAVAKLCEMGANPLASDRAGNTPAHYAAVGDHVEALKALLQTALKEKQRLVDEKEDKKRKEKLTAEAGQPTIRRFSVQPGMLDRASSILSKAGSGYGLPTFNRSESQSVAKGRIVSRRKSRSSASGQVKRKDRILEEAGEEEAAAAAVTTAETSQESPSSKAASPSQDNSLRRGRYREKRSDTKEDVSLPRLQPPLQSQAQPQPYSQSHSQPSIKEIEAKKVAVLRQAGADMLFASGPGSEAQRRRSSFSNTFISNSAPMWVDTALHSVAMQGAYNGALSSKRNSVAQPTQNPSSRRSSMSSEGDDRSSEGGADREDLDLFFFLEDGSTQQSLEDGSAVVKRPLMILEQPAKSGARALHAAVSADAQNAARYLISTGVDVSIVCLL